MRCYLTPAALLIPRNIFFLFCGHSFEVVTSTECDSCKHYKLEGFYQLILSSSTNSSCLLIYISSMLCYGEFLATDSK